jgi:hypothetical protein
MIGTVKPSGDELELSVVIAERTFPLFRRDGSAVRVTVRLGRPFQEQTLGDYRCPVKVVGIGDGRIRASWGEDPFVALQYAIDLAGLILDKFVQREDLEIRFRPGNPDRTGWIWRYPPQ